MLLNDSETVRARRYHSQVAMENRRCRNARGPVGIAALALFVDAKDARAVAFCKRNGFAIIHDEPRGPFPPIASALRVSKDSKGTY